jgi:hypothetical protein
MKNDFKTILKASKKHFKSLLLKLRFFDKLIYAWRRSTHDTPY